MLYFEKYLYFRLHCRVVQKKHDVLFLCRGSRRLELGWLNLLKLSRKGWAAIYVVMSVLWFLKATNMKPIFSHHHQHHHHRRRRRRRHPHRHGHHQHQHHHRHRHHHHRHLRSALDGVASNLLPVGRDSPLVHCYLSSLSVLILPPRTTCWPTLGTSRSMRISWPSPLEWKPTCRWSVASWSCRG